MPAAAATPPTSSTARMPCSRRRGARPFPRRREIRHRFELQCERECSVRVFCLLRYDLEEGGQHLAEHVVFVFGAKTDRPADSDGQEDEQAEHFHRFAFEGLAALA